MQIFDEPVPEPPPALLRLHARAHASGFLRRFTQLNRLLLVMAFLPTGMVKLLGHRFTILPIDNPVGFFFEAMYRTGPYWYFIGFAQVAAAILLLFPRTAPLGALIFAPVSVSIALITYGIGFGNTAIITALMVLSVIYLLAWDADRLWAGAAILLRRLPGRPLLGGISPLERTGWILGGVGGIGFWLGTRGMLPSASLLFPLLGVAVLGALLVIVGWVFPGLGPGGGAAMLLAVIALVACGQTGERIPVPTVERADPSIFDYDASSPPESTVHGTVEGDGFRRLDVRYPSPHGGDVPAFVWEPTAGGPHAGMIAMHGMPGDRSRLEPYAEAYARAGAVVIAISAPWARPIVREDILRFDERDAQEQVQLVVDLRRAVDLLLARDDVEPGRIGYVGVSYGGAMGGLLAGIEKRIRAYALVVGDGGLIAHFTDAEDARGPLSGLLAERRDAWLAAMGPIEPTLWVSQASPSELLFQNGRTDRLVPETDGLAYQAAGSEPKTVLWYDSGHRLPEEAWADQQDWFAERIAIAPSG